MVGHVDPLVSLLQYVIPRPVLLSSKELEPPWPEDLRDVAGSLPAPYPVFSRDESTVLAWGFPVKEQGIAEIEDVLAGLIQAEIRYRLRTLKGLRADKGHLMAARERFEAVVGDVLEHAAFADAGRHLPELLYLLVAARTRLLLEQLGAVALKEAHHDPLEGSASVWRAARSVARCLARAASHVSEKLSGLGPDAPRPDRSPVLKALVADLIPFAVSFGDRNLGFLSAWIRADLGEDPSEVRQLLDEAASALKRLCVTNPVLSAFASCELELEGVALLLHPRMLKLLERSGLLERLGLGDDHLARLRQLSVTLRRSELLCAVSSGVKLLRVKGASLLLVEGRRREEVDPTTRPYDFSKPGIVDTAVKRFGLVYDLVDFTSELEEIRKGGRAAEESAIRFMFLFQTQLGKIASRRKLRIEKFLGDGAFYSSRRAARALAAACEIQGLYERLRARGFPFSKGIRMALNYSTFHLVPLAVDSRSGPRFEFFGHGIVELARLTTGKSEREAAEIAEYLVHRGFDPNAVERFLEPLLRAGAEPSSAHRGRYRAWIDVSGQLINHGIVITLPFLEELVRELGEAQVQVVEHDGLTWVAVDVEGVKVLLRYLGTPKLKGLPPEELVEAACAGDELRSTGKVIPASSILVTLRRVAAGGQVDDVAAVCEEDVPPDAVLVSFLEGGKRVWVFGRYRKVDDVLLDAVVVPLQPPDLKPGEPIELWIFRNRGELYKLYRGLLQGSKPVCLPLEEMRKKDGYVGCFLAAPHRSPA